jgi:hypothetical protein
MRGGRDRHGRHGGDVTGVTVVTSRASLGDVTDPSQQGAGVEGRLLLSPQEETFQKRCCNVARRFAGSVATLLG